MKDTLLSTFLIWNIVIAALITKANYKNSPNGEGYRFNYYYRFTLNSLYVFGSFLMLIGAGYFAKQVYIWLMTAVWTKYSMIDGLTNISDSSWLASPSNWIGVHQVLENTPASLIFFMIGLLAVRATQMCDR
jgi:uncharacterized membrane protein